MKFIKNKRGASAIEMVIGFMILVMMLAFLVDIISVLSKFATASQVATDISRTIGVQGGALSAAPAGWPGGDSRYVSLSKLQSMVESKFKSAGVSKDEWSVTVIDNSQTTRLKIDKNGVQGSKINYLNNFTVEVRMKYRWETVSGLVPGLVEQTLVSKRPGTSEWQYDYHDWTEEGPGWMP